VVEGRGSMARLSLKGFGISRFDGWVDVEILDTIHGGRRLRLLRIGDLHSTLRFNLRRIAECRERRKKVCDALVPSPRFASPAIQSLHTHEAQK
jgi:hypothetical protein